MGKQPKAFAPPKRFRPFQADKGPWLIWSYYHNCWHCRSSSGSAVGYTYDVSAAGVFDENVARAYHEDGPRKHRRNVSVPAFKVAAALKHAAAVKRSEAEQIEAVLARIAPAGRAALNPSSSEGV